MTISDEAIDRALTAQGYPVNEYTRAAYKAAEAAGLTRGQSFNNYMVTYNAQRKKGFPHQAALEDALRAGNFDADQRQRITYWGDIPKPSMEDATTYLTQNNLPVTARTVAAYNKAMSMATPPAAADMVGFISRDAGLPSSAPAAAATTATPAATPAAAPMTAAPVVAAPVMPSPPITPSTNVNPLLAAPMVRNQAIPPGAPASTIVNPPIISTPTTANPVPPVTQAAMQPTTAPQSPQSPRPAGTGYIGYGGYHDNVTQAQVNAILNNGMFGFNATNQFAPNRQQTTNLQMQINAERANAGLPPITVDGYFGDETLAALQNYQQRVATPAAPAAVAAPIITTPPAVTTPTTTTTPATTTTAKTNGTTVGSNYTGGSGSILNDYLRSTRLSSGLGLLGNTATTAANLAMIKSMPDVPTPVRMPSIPVSTNYNIQPQLQENRNMLASGRASIAQSGVPFGVRANAMSGITANNLQNTGRLYAEKMNQEAQLKNFASQLGLQTAGMNFQEGNDYLTKQHNLDLYKIAQQMAQTTGFGQNLQQYAADQNSLAAQLLGWDVLSKSNITGTLKRAGID